MAVTETVLRYDNDSRVQVDHTGKVFGDLTVLRPGRKGPLWWFHCAACGSDKEIRFAHAKSEGQTHCGCLGRGQGVREAKGKAIISSSSQSGSKARQVEKEVRVAAVLKRAMKRELTHVAMQELADEFGVSVTTISRDFEAVLAEAKDQQQDHAARIRTLTIIRLERMIAQCEDGLEYFDTMGCKRVDSSLLKVQLAAMQTELDMVGMRKPAEDEGADGETLEILQAKLADAKAFLVSGGTK